MEFRTRLRRVAAGAAVATVALTVVAACGSSSSDGAKSATSKSATTASKAGTADTVVDAATKTTGAAKGPNAAFCTSWVNFDSAASAGPESGEEGPTPDQVVAFAKKLQPLAGKVTSAAPDDLTTPLETLGKMVDAAASDSTGQAGQALSPENPDLARPLGTVERWVFDNCGFTRLTAMGKDYSYAGMPETVEAGTASFSFMNMSKTEQHEMSIIEVADGSGVTAKQLADALRKDTNAAQGTYGDKVTFVGDVQAAPGETSYTTVDLTKGQYVIACFIPEQGKPDGKPHTELGMVSTFTVE